MSEEIAAFFDRLAQFAAGLQRRLAIFLLLAAAASLTLAWQLYSNTAPLWWNLLKTGFALVPLLTWWLIWTLLSNLREAPLVASQLATSEEMSLTQLRARISERKPGIMSLFSTIHELRNNEALEVMRDSIGSVTLLANPLFMIVAFIMLILLLLFIIAVPLAMLI